MTRKIPCSLLRVMPESSHPPAGIALKSSFCFHGQGTFPYLAYPSLAQIRVPPSPPLLPRFQSHRYRVMRESPYWKSDPNPGCPPATLLPHCSPTSSHSARNSPSMPACSSARSAWLMANCTAKVISVTATLREQPETLCLAALALEGNEAKIPRRA